MLRVRYRSVTVAWLLALLLLCVQTYAATKRSPGAKIFSVVVAVAGIGVLVILFRGRSTARLKAANTRERLLKWSSIAIVVSIITLAIRMLFIKPTASIESQVAALQHDMDQSIDTARKLIIRSYNNKPTLEDRNAFKQQLIEDGAAESVPLAIELLPESNDILTADLLDVLKATTDLRFEWLNGQNLDPSQRSLIIQQLIAWQRDHSPGPPVTSP